jgi:hypothetical protein
LKRDTTGAWPDNVYARLMRSMEIYPRNSYTVAPGVSGIRGPLEFKSAIIVTLRISPVRKVVRFAERIVKSI